MVQKGTVLIVDDEAGPREALRMILKPLYQIFTAADGEEALQLIQQERIDVIALDLKMPKMSGIDVLREIQKMKSSIDIIVITGYSTLSNAQEAIRHGAINFISKPFNMADIVSIFSKAFERRNYNRKIKDIIYQIKGLKTLDPEEEHPSSLWGVNPIR